MRKFLSIISAILVLSSIMTSACFADTTGSIIASYDFEGETPSESKPESGEGQVYLKDENNNIYMYDGFYSTAKNDSRFFPKQGKYDNVGSSGKYLIEYKLMYEDVGGGNYYHEICMEFKNPATNKSDWFYYNIRYMEAGGYMNYNTESDKSGQSDQSVNAGMKSGEWYIVRLALDFAEGKSTFSVCDLNGKTIKARDYAIPASSDKYYFYWTKTRVPKAVGSGYGLDDFSIREVVDVTLNYDSEMGAVKVAGKEIANGEKISVTKGGSINVEATGNEGYIFKSMTLGDSTVSTNPAIFSDISSDAELKVLFEEKQDVNPAIETNSSYNYFKTVDGKPTLFVYGKINDYTTSGASSYGMMLWDKAEPSDAVRLPMMAVDGNEAVSAPGTAFAIKVYGSAIKSGKTYVFSPFIGEKIAESKIELSFTTDN